MRLAPIDATRAPAEVRRTWPGAQVGILLGLLGLAVLLTALALDLHNDPSDRVAAKVGWGAVTASIGLIPISCAIPVLVRHPRHGVGWVMAATGLLWGLDGVAEAWAARGLAATPDLPLTGFVVWFVFQLGAYLLCALPLILVLYPSGRPLPGRWGRLSLLVIAMATALPTLLVFAPPTLIDTDGFELPVATGMPVAPVPEGVYLVLLTVGRFATLLSLVLAVVIVFVRQRRASGLERARLRWLVWAAVMCVVLASVSLIAPTGVIPSVLIVLCLGVTGVSVAIGILRPDLTDVDALMGGTVVFAAVAAIVIAIDLALVALLDAVVGDSLDERRVTLFVLVVAVAAYGPLRSWMSVLVRRVLVGRRGDRYDVVSGLAARLEESADVTAQLPALASAVATTFKLGYVGVEVFGHTGGTLRATYGAEPGLTREVPIRYGADVVGRLLLPARGVRSMLSRRDQELLVDVVRQAAMAVRSSRLAEELQVSREQLVLAREDDRRRIRRDLHDGLGPVLGGVAMRLDAVANLIETDPERARTMVAQSRSDITEALADVRRLVHGLRPPALDDLGLIGAVAQQVERTRSPQLAVAVEDRDVPPLPAAVEVAAYRIVSEGLANTVRHARATTCTVRLGGEPGQLLVEVVDDGDGIPSEMTAGVGLRSIRERAEELGGRAEVVCPSTGGTLVRAWLPLSTGNVKERA